MRPLIVRIERRGVGGFIIWTGSAGVTGRDLRGAIGLLRAMRSGDIARALVFSPLAGRLYARRTAVTVRRI